MSSIGRSLASAEPVPHPATGLPGPSRFSSLTWQERSLVGVARWPDPQHNNEDSMSQQAYGQSFWKASRDIGSQISEGRVSSFRELWSQASDWRRSAAGGDAKGFDLARHPTQPNTVTALEGRYEYIRDRYSTRTDGEVMNSWRNGIPSFRRFQLKDEIDGHSIQLSAIMLSTDPTASWYSPDSTAFREAGFPAEGSPFHVEHVAPAEVPRIMAHAESLYSRALDPSVPNSQALTTLGELHWWVANAMPDDRGSAAKAELSVRSMAQSRGMDLPSFKKGFVPDLEAVTTPRSEFTAKYPAMFDWKSVSWRSGE